METPAILGVVVGSVIGGIYVVWQALDLRRQQAAAADGKVLALAPSAVLRLVLVAGGWWVAYHFTKVDKWWLTGSLLLTYSLPLVWQLKKLFFTARH
jgi:hypothetical protein